MAEDLRHHRMDRHGAGVWRRGGRASSRHPWPWWNDQYATYAAWAGLAAVLIYMAGQWRDVAEFYKGRSAKYGTMSLVSIVVFLGILVAINYLATRQNKRWDLTANQVYSLSDQTIKVLKDLPEPVKFTVFDPASQVRRFRNRLDCRYQYQSSKLHDRVRRSRSRAGARQAAKIEALRTVAVRIQGPHRARDLDRRAGPHQRADQGRHRRGEEGLLHAGPRREEHRGHRSRRLQRRREELKQDNFAFEQLVLIQQKTVPDDATVVVIAGPTTDFFPPEIEALKAYVAKGGKVFCPARSAAARRRPQPLLTQFLMDWGISAGNDIVLDASGMGQLLGTDDSVPVAAAVPAARRSPRASAS